MAPDQETTMLPVRSAIFKQDTGGLVIRWVTTGEYPLLYVFGLFMASGGRREGRDFFCGRKGLTHAE
jgi:hypothetical protein